MGQKNKKISPSQSGFENLILKGINQGVAFVSPKDRTFIYTSPTFEKMYGYENGELIGQSIHILIDPDRIPSVDDYLNRAISQIEELEVTIVETKNIKKDGSLILTADSISLFDHPEYGKILVSIKTDLSERVKFIEQLESKNRDLQEAKLTLRKVLDTFDKEKSEIIAHVMEHVEKHVRPLLTKLTAHCPRGSQDQSECQKKLDVLDKVLVRIALDLSRDSKKYDLLMTRTELRVMELIKEYLTLKEIAKLEGSSINTIKSHIRNIRRKMGLKSSDGALKGILRHSHEPSRTI